MSNIKLSVIVLTFDHLDLTRACVDSIRRGTDAEYELIIVDNGSQPETAAYARTAADKTVLNEENLGFAAGMNCGLAAADGEFIVFANNDTVFPDGWARSLLGVFEDHPNAGIVLPAVTAAGNPVSVRDTPGTETQKLAPFGELPSGVVYMLRTSTIRQLGGWDERYPVASSEDLDLCFTVWANDLDIVLDTTVLVQHVSQATVSTVLPNLQERYRINLEMFLDRWSSEEPAVTRLESCSNEAFDRNLRAARAAAKWLERLISTRRQLEGARSELREANRRIASTDAGRAGRPSAWKRWIQYLTR